MNMIAILGAVNTILGIIVTAMAYAENREWKGWASSTLMSFSLMVSNL